MDYERPRVMVVGAGNEYRRDDGVGLVVARKLNEALAGESVKVVESDGGAGLIEAWKDAEIVIVIDAVCSGGTPGEIYRFDAREKRLPVGLFRCFSTHGVNVADTIELARSLSQLPLRLIVYGVEGKDFEAGVGLSPDVERAVTNVVRCVVNEIRTN